MFKTITPPASTANASLAAQAVPPPAGNSAWARYLWALPMLLSILFVVAVIAWLQRTDTNDREERRQTMIADALTLEAQLRAQLDAESVQLQELARSVQTTGFSTGQFMASAEVNAGLNRFWQSVTWLDQNNRLRAHATAQSGKLNADASVSLDERGISSHLVAILYGPHSRSNNPITGSVVVRYSPTALLKRSVPWWLARKYEVRLIDGLEQEMANLETPLPGATVGKRVLERASYRVSFDPAIRDAYIELTEHDPFVPWYRTLPPTLMAGFLMLIMVATWMLRRQMQVVSPGVQTARKQPKKNDQRGRTE